MESLIIRFWVWVLTGLKKVSVFHLVGILFPKLRNKYSFVDLWVLGNFILSFLCLFYISDDSITYIKIIATLYGGFRVMEIVVYQANILFVDPYIEESKSYSLHSYRRLLLLSLHNYFEIIGWFAMIYRTHNLIIIDDQRLTSVIGALYYSIVTTATLGYGDITPSKDLGRLIVSIQVCVAIFFTLIILARFLSYLPQPKSQDKDEQL